MKRKWMVVIASAALLALTACGQEETGGSTSAADGEVAGTLSFYTSQPDADAQKLVEGFEKKYPDVNVETYRSGTEEVISKLNAEKMAGDVQADVLLVADSVTFEDLKEQDMLQAYESGELDAVPDDFEDKDHYYTGTKIMATGIVTNTEQGETPKSWEALTDASGKTVMPSPLYSGAAAYNLGVLTRQDNFGWEFYEKLKKQDTTVVKGNGDVLKSVASGEKQYGVIVDFLAARAKADGSPVELVYPEEGVPVITEPIGITKNTDNAAAAEAFVDYVLSEDGQKLATELGYTPIREGIDAPEGLKTYDEMKVLQADTEELYSSRNKDKQQFEDLFGK
ncbi:iron(III) transport system substrate-binding protein [Terribacillus aidingensis]|uniref:Iron(III) transport system substrate-binding protein n=1 Tax=Terribacillus aidingensis TaxID=586416 RepID=A0A285NYU8_9BACI|nr:ABC transporter substrate-binding protein [Terribacillus aidingensis]SNZ14103.1 iron(III) transport system substrate-binding protein [Terribacillus aidingensis]